MKRTLARAACTLMIATSAVTSLGTIAHAETVSPLAWTATGVPTGSDWSALASNQDLAWVIVGDNGGIMLSNDDGVTWSRANVDAKLMNVKFNAVEYSNGVWVAVGNSGFIATSTDGARWTGTQVGTSQWRGVAASPSRWIAYGGDGTSQVYAYSDDKGATWIQGNAPFPFAIDDISYGNGVWVGVGGSDGSTTGKHVVYSTNGTTWQTTSNAAANWIDVAFGNDMLVALSAAGGVSTSQDGITWSETTYPLSSDMVKSATWTSVAIGVDGFVAIGSGFDLLGEQIGVAAYSANGEQWKTADAPLGSWEAIQPDNDGFLALSAPGASSAKVTRAVLKAPAGNAAASDPWFQATGRQSADGKCAEGWAGSWAQWMNDGTGGFTCERVIANSATHGDWMVFKGGQWWDAPDSIYRRG